MTKTTVLIPIDDASFSLQILPYVQRLLYPAQTKLILLHVEPAPEGILIEQGGREVFHQYADQEAAILRANFADSMRPLVKSLQEAGCEAITDMAFGKPAQAIETRIQYAPVDLIAMTTHGRSGVERLILGSVAEHLLRHTTIPLLLYHAISKGEGINPSSEKRSTFMTKNKVLIPIENPEFSLQILPHVQRLLDPAQNHLVLLHVEPEQETLHIERPGFAPLDLYADQAEATMRVNFAVAMEPIVKPLQEAGFTVSTDMLFGKPAQAIEAHLTYEPVDMIAMTTHGRTGVERLMLGSVAEHVLRHTHIPLLILHTTV